ncbi:MAG: DNA alkylation repair protein [Bacteroidota bacterium]
MIDKIIRQVSSLPVQKTAPIRKIRKEYSKQIKDFSSEEVLRLAHQLIARSQFVYRWIAYELIANHDTALHSLGAKEIEKLGQGIDSWYSVDTFACILSGVAWREEQIPDSLIYRWAKSKDHWWRRAALVSTVPLNLRARGGQGDVKRTLSICELLLGDRDDMVVKGFSWALRQLVIWDAPAVKKFLSMHKNNLAPRVVREVNNKLATDLKNPRPKNAKK